VGTPRVRLVSSMRLAAAAILAGACSSSPPPPPEQVPAAAHFDPAVLEGSMPLVREAAERAEDDPFPVLHDEHIGPLRVGMPKEEVLRLVPGLWQHGPVIEEGATGEWVESWHEPKEGLDVGFSASTEYGPRALRSVEITAPSRLVTRRNVGIGAAYDGVRAEYQDVLDRDFPPTPTTIIAGSLYGGLIFRFEGGVVQSIFLGAGAE
jgi:hypothetical protein